MRVRLTNMGSRLLPISKANVVTLIKPEAQKEAFLSSVRLQMPMTADCWAWPSWLCVSLPSEEAHSVPPWPSASKWDRKSREEGWGGKRKRRHSQVSLHIGNLEIYEYTGASTVRNYEFKQSRTISRGGL